MFSFNAAFLCLALAIDAVFGWPDFLFARLGHPVILIGRAIEQARKYGNREQDPARLRFFWGALTAVLVIAAAALLGVVAQSLLPNGWIGLVCAAVLAWPWLAARSLADHVHAVINPLADQHLPQARVEIAKIVGRDPTQLDGAAIARAALESLAENTCDGVVAPLCWGLCLGLPGLFAYKAINTLDSMIAHRTPELIHFGRFSAHVDDVANWLCARLTGLLYVVVGRNISAGEIMLRDAGKHRSPNAGWPEAAMAGLLGVRLSGPRIYSGCGSLEPWLNGGARDPDAADISRGLIFFWRVIALCGLMLSGLSVL